MSSNITMTSYIPSWAESGKFARINKEYLESTYGYPASGEGRFAIFAKIIDPIPSENSASAQSAFGEPLSVPLTPVIQLDAIYGINNLQYDQINSNGGYVAVSGYNIMTVATGTGTYGYGVLRTKRTIRYRPGQGALSRFTASFSPGTSGYIQRAGLFTQEQALQVGYQNEQFGIIHQNGGKAQIMELVITSAGSSGETITTVINNIEHTFVLSGSNNIAANTANIAQSLSGLYAAGWIVSHVGNKICILNKSLGEKPGVYNISSSGTLEGTFNIAQVGVDDNVVFIPQTEFNIDKLDGTGSSRMSVNPQKLNVYQINFRWLGVGEIKFAIEDDITGNLIVFHKIIWSNKNNTTHVDNPSFKIGYIAASLGGTGSNIIVQGASMMGAIEGVITPTQYPSVISYAKKNTNWNANNIHHLFTLQNNLISNSKINLRENLPKKLAISASTTSQSTALVFLYMDAQTDKQLLFESVGFQSSYSITDSLITGGNPIAAFTIASDGADNIDINDLRIAIPPNAKLTFGISSTSNIGSVEAALTFVED